MYTFERKINYYETDRMGIVHHSNYIRWMEEARVHYLDEIGFGYDALEKSGIISPVIGIEGDYKMTTTFDDIINIKENLFILSILYLIGVFVGIFIDLLSILI